MIIIRNFCKINQRYFAMNSSFDLQEYSYTHNSKARFAKNNKNQPESSSQKPTKMKTKKKLCFEDSIVVFNKIFEWRKNNEAAVDTMGCHKQADPKAPIQIQKYHWLISLMLSIQTKDQTTSMIMTRLKEKGLTPQNIVQYQEQSLRQLIYESNFNKRKAANIIKVSKTILQKGKIADNLNDLVAYPGVGIKIAMLYLKIAEGKAEEGIGVDTHVHRISNRLGWVKSDSPQQTQTQLQQLFPKKMWQDINECIVGFGQIRCSARNPLCKGCPVEQHCPSKYKW